MIAPKTSSHTHTHTRALKWGIWVSFERVKTLVGRVWKSLIKAWMKAVRSGLITRALWSWNKMFPNPTQQRNTYFCTNPPEVNSLFTETCFIRSAHVQNSTVRSKSVLLYRLLVPTLHISIPKHDKNLKHNSFYRNGSDEPACLYFFLCTSQHCVTKVCAYCAVYLLARLRASVT